MAKPYFLGMLTDPLRPAPHGMRRYAALTSLLGGLVLSGCGGGGCSGVVGDLGPGSKVADYQGPLAESCEDYDAFVAAYEDIPEGEGPGVVPGAILIFCAPVEEPQTPTKVYESDLCKSARAEDTYLTELSNSPGAGGRECYFSPFEPNSNGNCTG